MYILINGNAKLKYNADKWKKKSTEWKWKDIVIIGVYVFFCWLFHTVLYESI